MCQCMTYRWVMVRGNGMGETLRKVDAGQRQDLQMRFIEATDERADVPARRVEVRSMLVRLLVKLYVERNQELVKDAA